MSESKLTPTRPSASSSPSSSSSLTLLDCDLFPETRKQLNLVLVPYYFSHLLKDRDLPPKSIPIYKPAYDTARQLFLQSMEKRYQDSYKDL